MVQNQSANLHLTCALTNSLKW